jgi:hypothetical protein
LREEKNLKEYFQLPGKFGAILENLFGEKQKFLGVMKHHKNKFNINKRKGEFNEHKNRKCQQNQQLH